MLADFRRWLEDIAHSEPAGLSRRDKPGGLPDMDLATLVAAFTALRHEVNLQTKATRAQAEQFAQTLEGLKQPEGDNDAARPLVAALTEAFDTLARTAAEVERLRETAVAPASSFWQRLFGARESETILADRLAAAATGLRMSERRVERLMAEVGVVPMTTIGQPFDPETMEAVEAIADTSRDSGTVVDEVRRGYRWRGRVFRFAQVRVAK